MSNEEMVIVRVKPPSKWRYVAIVSVILALIIVIFGLGHRIGQGQGVGLTAKNKDLQIQVGQFQQNLEDKVAENAKLKKSAELNARTVEEVRQELLISEQKITDLEKDVEFYRGLMAPAEMQRGVRFHEFKIKFDALTEQYNLNAVITNAGGKGNVIKGMMNMSVLALVNGKQKTLSLSALPDFEGAEPVKLRFRFFQNINLSFSLPRDVYPVSLVVSSNVKNLDQKPFKAQFEWEKVLEQ